MKLHYIAVLAMAALLGGCAVVDVTKTAKGFYEPTSASELDILKTRPQRSYDELGTVTASGFETTETAIMHNSIRTKAAALGANAVILTEEGFVEDKHWATGVAIRYK